MLYVFESLKKRLNLQDYKWRLPDSVSSRLKHLKRDFNASDSSRSFPVLSSTLGLLLALKPTRTAIFSPISFIGQSVIERERVPRLETQKKKKPVILFDFNNFLCCDRFSLSRFDFVTYKRLFCEEFLFNMAHYYEMVGVSDRSAPSGHRILQFLDPLGCIGYHVFLRDKREMDSAHLNRDLRQLTVITTSDGEFSSDFNRNLLRLPQFRVGETSTATHLTDLMHFFTNLYYMNVKDVRGVLESYRNSDFVETFTDVQKRLFRQRNLLSFNSYDEKVKEINRRKTEEYKTAKKKIAVEAASTSQYKEYALAVMKNILL